MCSPSTLLLRIGGPLQAWGDQSRFERRMTRPEPTKSGILGLVAAAQGRSREDDLTDLGVLAYGVRTEQEGRLVRDYQTAQRPDSVLGKGWANPKLSYRYYLADALFLVGIQGDRALLEGIAEAVRSPEFPLYLGRRACPPTLPIVFDRYDGEPREAIVDGDVKTVLQREPWIAAEWYRRKQGPRVSLRLIRDAVGDDRVDETVRDVPLSFSPERRTYVWRNVVHDEVEKDNPDAWSVRSVAPKNDPAAGVTGGAPAAAKPRRAVRGASKDTGSYAKATTVVSDDLASLAFTDDHDPMNEL